jgi:hypothetical protein
MMAAVVTSPGIVDGMAPEDYYGDPCPVPALSNSLIKPLLSQSPYHAWLQHPRLNPRFAREEDSKYDLGTASHAMLLQGLNRCEPIDADDWRTKDARTLRDLAWAEGKVPLLRKTYDAAKVMKQRATEFLEHTEFAGILQRGKPEQSMFWQDYRGIWMKARMDFLTDRRDVILDYKSTAMDPRRWKRAMTDSGYDTQSVLYPRGLSVLGHHGTRFVFLVQETCEPYGCWLVEPTESMRELANMKITRAVRLWAECLETNRWPSYPYTVQPAEAPGYALIEEEAMQ